MAGWDGSEPDDLGSQGEVGEPGEHGLGQDHPGSPYGESKEEGAISGVPGGDRGWEEFREPIKENTSKGGLQGIWDKQTQEWKQAPGAKAAVNVGSSLMFTAAGAKTLNPIAIAGGFVMDAIASAAGLYGPTTPKGIGDTDYWYGDHKKDLDKNPFEGNEENRDTPQPKKRKAPRSVSAAGSGNKPDLMVRTRSQDRQAKSQITRRV